MATIKDGKVVQTIGTTLCQYCGAITLIPGFNTCERCMTDEVHFIPISDIADVIVGMDQLAWSIPDRMAYFRAYHVTKQQVAAAEEEVELRYKALQKKRNRHRRW
jgi:hypothetical protein